MIRPRPRKLEALRRRRRTQRAWRSERCRGGCELSSADHLNRLACRAALREFEASISADVRQVEERELVEQASLGTALCVAVPPNSRNRAQAEEADEKEELLRFEQQCVPPPPAAPLVLSPCARRLCVARVEELKQQAAARRQAALQRPQQTGAPLARQTAGAASEHSSDSGSDAPDDSLVDWRAKRM